MPKLLHFPWLRRLLNKGVNTDVLPELMPDGTAREAINVRPGSITGNAGGAEAVKGEVVQYPVPVGEDPTGYVLIGSCTCNNQLVEFWASESFDGTEIYAPIVRVDGVVVAKSKNIPYVWDRPLQIAVADDFFGTSISANEDANGVVRGRGVVYPADHNSAPLYWDINQLVNFATSTPQNLAYFGDNYQVGFNSVGLFNTPEFPIHTRNLDSPSGLPVGQYQYALRYVTPAGDRTNVGPWTPLITVPLNQSEILPWQQSHYPGATTVGGVPAQPSPYGIEIRFRVDNVFGFQSIEVVRKAYNTADNIENNTVVATIPITPNQISVVTFRDPEDSIASDSQEIITDEELNIKIMAINKPKAVEYSDRRLTYANFETFPKIAGDVEFIERDGKTIFPVTQGVCTRYFSSTNNPNGENPREWDDNHYYWNDGYSDPVNNTYLKSFMRGERYGIGVMFWNQFAEQSFVREVPLGPASITNEGYQFPNRRDKRLGRSFVYSGGYQGVNDLSTVQASNDLTGNPGGVVFPTFEAFSQGAVRKNIPGSSNGPWNGYGNINRLTFGGSTFTPFGPTNPVTNPTPTNDQTRLSQSPNGFGYITAAANSGSYPDISWTPASEYQIGAPGEIPLTGNIWAPRHYALGGMIEGVSNIPSNTTIMSVMRTAPAGRVVAQGIACWRVNQTGNTPSGSQQYTKDLNRLSVLIPDFKNAVVSQSIIDLFETNPTSFGIQFVSPLGFYTEQYSGATFNRVSAQRVNQSGASDFLSYAGVQWDNGQVVNNGLLTDAYTVPSSNAQYVGYGAWRSDAGIASNVWSSEGGNRVFSISNVQSITENQSPKWDITISDDIYNYQYAGSGTAVTSNTPEIRNWHEPWYVVNIVIDEAVIPNDSIDKYVETGYHIKTESCIGITPSQSQQNGIYQDFPLLNERRGDVYASYSSVIQAYPASSPGDAEHNRYVYVDNGSGAKPWLCVTDNFYANINALGIIFSLSTDGFFTMPDGVVVYGVYSLIAGEWRSSSMEQFVGTVRFGQWISVLGGAPSLDVAVPPDGCRILVRYNSYEPIRFFGGDCTVSPSLDALFNRSFMYGGDGSISASDLSNSFAVDGLPMPYRRWSKALEYQVPLISALPNGLDIAMPANFLFGQSAKRQWSVYWDAEQRSAIRHSSSSANGPFEWPRIGYLLKWAGSWGVNLNAGLYSYPIDVDGYNLNTISNSALGGFILGSSINTNYIQQAPVSGFGVPFVSSGGEFTEKFYFPTGLVASLEFNQLAQDIPSLRTFLELNLKTISEENGEIKTIASALAGGGRNLYAWTDNGVARVLTSKNVLTGASGELISTQAVENYWGEEMWISRNIGIPDQMWQAFVKGYAPTGDGYADNFFWANRNSLYRMVGDSIIDIGREKFLAYMLPILRDYPRGYVPGTNGFYNAKYNEAWMSFNEVLDENNKASRKLVVFNPRINDWNGLYTYDFDGHTQVGNDVFGHRGLQTFKLDQGWTINATTREASVTVPMVGDIDTFKEFIRWRVVGSKPDKMQILDPDFVLMSEMPNPLVFPINPLWVKEYDGWEGWADRTLASYPPGDRKLPQKRYFYLRLIWNREEDVNATSLSGQLKPIK